MEAETTKQIIESLRKIDPHKVIFGRMENYGY